MRFTRDEVATGKPADALRAALRRADGRGYKAYKDIEGVYAFANFTLLVDHVQGDPFAAPSRVRVRVPQAVAGFPQELFSSRTRRVALEDFLARRFDLAVDRVVRGRRGTGKSGLIAIDRCGQEVLERSSLAVTPAWVEARFFVGLPARGRTVLGMQAEEMFFEEVPRIVQDSLVYARLDARAVRDHVGLVEDYAWIRARLRERGLVAFVGNGSILPRQSGISDEPLVRGAVPFVSPASLEVSFAAPNSGEVRGMGVPAGVTLIVGGGYHGKSTLLRALERGVYPHIRGDGREFVVTVEDAVKIRAEDGRRVENVDISCFISNLPYGQDTVSFSTDGASGSTSQAANIVEALEVGARLLLLDEDTSATNFMIRDVRMQNLVPKEKEPITPFIDRVRQLYEEHGVSTIMVMGGCGDYFDVADTVVMMDEYRPQDVSAAARRVAAAFPGARVAEVPGRFGRVRQRIPLPESFDPRRGGKKKIGAKGPDAVQFGRSSIDLRYVEQIVSESQTRAIGDIIDFAVEKFMDGKRTLAEIVEAVDVALEAEGLEIISPFKGRPAGDYARPRKYEMAAAVNRLRTLRVK